MHDETDGKTAGKRLTDEQLRQLRQQLETEKEILLSQLKESGRFGLATPVREVLSDSSADNHPADEGTEMFERSKDLALSDHFERLIARIDRALAAMDQGTYGKCEVCGRDIPFERLEAIPYTPYCVNHAREQFVSANRPIEEELLERNLARAFSERPDSGRDEGENAWEIVERWGTASSPAFTEDRPGENDGSWSMDADDGEGYVEPIESFLATDLYGRRAAVVRSREYRAYMESMEGDRFLEPDPAWSPDWADAESWEAGDGWR